MILKVIALIIENDRRLHLDVQSLFFFCSGMKRVGGGSIKSPEGDLRRLHSRAEACFGHGAACKLHQIEQ